MTYNLGRRNRAGSALPAGYFEGRASAARNSKKGEDVYDPVSHYAGVVSPLTTNLPFQNAGPRIWSMIVGRRLRWNGISTVFEWGADNMAPYTKTSTPRVDGGMTGQLSVSEDQPVLIQNRTWSLNTGWYNCWNGTGGAVFNGSRPERYDYPSFRVAQLDTSVTGGPGPTTQRMGRRAMYTRVQAIPKYRIAPRRYNTRSAGS